VHDVRSFLGLVNYFRNFIEHFSDEIAVPLTNLTKKSHPWVWTGHCQDAFELLKQKLIEAPLLRTPDERLPYEVVTDASDLGLGGVLLQEVHHVAFESRKLNYAELNYQTTEKVAQVLNLRLGEARLCFAKNLSRLSTSRTRRTCA
jgi:hypothetical protein